MADNLCQFQNCPFNLKEWGEMLATVRDIKTSVDENKQERQMAIENLEDKVEDGFKRLDERISELDRKYNIVEAAQDTKLSRLQFAIIALACFLGGLGVINIVEFAKGLLK